MRFGGTARWCTPGRVALKSHRSPDIAVLDRMSRRLSGGAIHGLVNRPLHRQKPQYEKPSEAHGLPGMRRHAARHDSAGRSAHPRTWVHRSHLRVCGIRAVRG